MPELSIVIPVYNNAESLEILVGAIDKALNSKLSYQIIMVNDGSQDNSWELIQKLIRDRSFSDPLTAINLKENYGQENAKMAGLKYATGEYIVFMDADYQHDPEHIFELMKECSKGFDVCYANFNNSPVHLFKRAGSDIYNYMSHKLLSKPKGVYLSSYNMMKKHIAEKAVLYQSPLVNMDAIVLKETQNVTQIFVEQRKSLNKKTNYTPMKLVSLFFRLLPGFSTLPLRLILLTGISLASIGTALLIVKIALHFIEPTIHFLGYAKLLILLIGGIILTALGVIGEYIGKVYVMLNNAKPFEIQTIISSDTDEKK